MLFMQHGLPAVLSRTSDPDHGKFVKKNAVLEQVIVQAIPADPARSAVGVSLCQRPWRKSWRRSSIGHTHTHRNSLPPSLLLSPLLSTSFTHTNTTQPLHPPLSYTQPLPPPPPPSLRLPLPLHPPPTTTSNNKASTKRAHFFFVTCCEVTGAASAAKAATTALVVATRAAVDRCGSGHIYTPQRTAPEDGQGRGGGTCRSTRPSSGSTSLQAGALQLVRRRARREAACQPGRATGASGAGPVGGGARARARGSDAAGLPWCQVAGHHGHSSCPMDSPGWVHRQPRAVFEYWATVIMQLEFQQSKFEQVKLPQIQFLDRVPDIPAERRTHNATCAEDLRFPRCSS